MLYRTLISCCLIVLVAACNSGSSSPQSQSSNPAPRSLESRLQGTWEKTGYGDLVVIEQDQLTRYEVTNDFCVLAGQLLLDDVDGLELAEDDASFVINDTALGFEDHFVQVADLPDACDAPLGNTPTELFEYVWATFNEHYPFFAERNVDWLAQYDLVRDQISNEMNDEDLFIALATLVSPLDDAHVSLSAGEDWEYAPERPKGVIGIILEEFLTQNLITDFEEYQSQALNQWTSILIDSYLDDQIATAGGPDDDMLLWGTIDSEIAYLRIDRMQVSEDDTDQQLADLAPILDQVFADLAHSSAIIVDVRINQGGTDPIAIAIANRFADRQRLAVRKYARSLNGDGAVQQIDLTPATELAYLKPTILLTSGTTTSAAEVFTLAMREIPHVTHMGESTNGSISDALEKTLPNGWQFSLANEVYSGADGIAYEGMGISPDIEAPIFDAAMRQSEQDSGVNAAIQWLINNQ